MDEDGGDDDEDAEREREGERTDGVLREPFLSLSALDIAERSIIPRFRVEGLGFRGLGGRVDDPSSAERVKSMRDAAIAEFDSTGVSGFGFRVSGFGFR
eukprot:2576490-Rhodomonas_salina.1